MPEVWRYDDQHLRISRLRGDRYVETHESEALQNFPVALAEEILNRRIGKDETQLIREFVRAC